MKNILIYILLLIPGFASSQLPVVGPEHINNKRFMIIKVLYNQWPSYAFNRDYKWKTTGGTASFLYSYKRDINVGAEVYYHSMLSATLQGQRYDEFLNTTFPFSYYYQVNVKGLNLKGQYYWLNHRIIGLYAGLDLGFVSGKSEPIYTSDHVGYLDDYKISPLSMQLTLFGMHFAPGTHLFCNIELGYGTRGSVCAGLGYRIYPRY